jgi:uncharacterized protein YqjF (DUF2071 family)
MWSALPGETQPIVTEIDRIAPTRRPSGKPAGYQRWRSLLFLHWAVPTETLRPLLPVGLELDLYGGQAYVGLVPFAMEGVRPFWYPESLALRFLETNVRTYVICRGRPGVYFLSLDANSLLAVQTARLGWGLPYYLASMAMREQNDAVHYSVRRHSTGARLDVRYRVGAVLGPSAPGTLEHFFLERYLLFVLRRGHLFAGQVHHPPYPAQEVSVEEIHDELIAASGLPAASGPPEFAHFARGVDVEVFPLQRQ